MKYTQSSFRVTLVSAFSRDAVSQTYEFSAESFSFIFIHYMFYARVLFKTQLFHLKSHFSVAPTLRRVRFLYSLIGSFLTSISLVSLRFEIYLNLSTSFVEERETGVLRANVKLSTLKVTFNFVKERASVSVIK